MSYVMIQNQGELPLWGMRLLGYSNKGPGDIGRFGTGLKEAIVLCGRLGEFPIIFSGTCRMDFRVEETEGVREICFRLSEERGKFTSGEWHGLGLHPDFGHYDWNDPWMVLREVFCNALDASGVDNLHHDVLSGEPEGVAGSTRVFIPCTPKMMEAYGKACSRLLVLEPREVAWEGPPHGRALERQDAKSPAQVFHKGVWVGSWPEASCFDYELDRIVLTESRSTDLHGVFVETTLVLSYAEEPMAAKILTAMREGPTFEAKCIDNCPYMTTNASDGIGWARAFYALHGDKAALCLNDKNQFERLTERGYLPVACCNERMYQWLKDAGVPHFREIVTETVDRIGTIMDPSEAAQRQFDEVWGFMSQFAGGKPKPRLQVFSGGQENVYGHQHQDVCYVHVDLVGSNKAREVHIEEIAHYISGYGDGTREFQLFLVECLEKLSRTTFDRIGETSA